MTNMKDWKMKARSAAPWQRPSLKRKRKLNMRVWKNSTRPNLTIAMM